MDGMVSLRCKFCGAPLSESSVTSDSDYVTCEYCGTTQQRVDARKYMEDMVAQVKDWIAKSMPMAYSAGGAENVDPVARHNIFIRDVAPRLLSELDQFTFSNLSLLGTCLLTMPLRTVDIPLSGRSSNAAFEFNAKIRSVSPLAVTDDDKAIIDEAALVSETYALTVNNIRLLGEKKDGRWGIMSNNFNELSKSFSRSKGYGLPAERYAALSEICYGFDKLMNGDYTTAYGKIKAGREQLGSLLPRTMDDHKFMVMYSAIEHEISIAKMMQDILDITMSCPASTAEFLKVVKDVINTIPASHGMWNHLLKDSSRYKEVLSNISSVISAKNDGTIPIASGDGELLFPFWEVDLRYTFTTGVLWKKKSVEVKEDLLICADFINDVDCLNNPASAITDIFADRPNASFKDSVLGNEKSISGGQGIGRIHDSVQDGYVGGRKVMLPLSTKAEAEKLCSEYMRQSSAKLEQFGLMDPIVRRIIYVPCRMVNGRLGLPSDFGNLVPAHISKINASSLHLI